MANVYKPPMDQIYTRSASPDYIPPQTSRTGKLVTLATSTIGTYTLYTRPEGYRARACYILLWKVFNQTCTIRIDGNIFYQLVTATSFFTQTPLLNTLYDTSTEITKDLTVQVGANNEVGFTAIVVEERIVNN